LLELYLWASDDGPQPPVASRTEKVAEEASDVLICLLNFCEQAGVDILQATANKIRQNELKYPIEQVKGRLEKHSEYPAHSASQQVEE
jgi:negative regulator of replication initiation